MKTDYRSLLFWIALATGLFLLQNRVSGREILPEKPGETVQVLPADTLSDPDIEIYYLYACNYPDEGAGLQCRLVKEEYLPVSVSPQPFIREEEEELELEPWMSDPESWITN